MKSDNSLYYTILLNLGGFGLKGRAASADRVGRLVAEIERDYEAGRLDEDFYRFCMGFSFDGAAPAFARSIIVVASPCPALSASFEVEGKRFDVVVPPNYVDVTDKEAEECLSRILNERGYRVEKANPPLKLLATRTGLATYGRNNITYVEGMGSYYRLSAYYTDAPLPEEHWGDPRMLDRCRRCVACATMCPTGAIGRDRFLLHAEKCLTFHNEQKPPFPDWVDDGWHHCLIGCLYCQKFCPEDRSFARWIEPVATFTSGQTRQILDGAPLRQLKKCTRDKIERLGLLEYYEILARNLAAVMANQGDSGSSAPEAFEGQKRGRAGSSQNSFRTRPREDHRGNE